MKKYIIWLVIALMTVALIGIILIQTRWIMTSIELNENKFNKEVFSALTNVEKRLAKSVEPDEFLSNTFHAPRKGKLNGLTRLQLYIQNEKLKDSTFLVEELSALLSKYQSNPTTNILEGLDYSQYIAPHDLIGLIKIREINEFLRQELHKRGITNNYNYGVFSNETQNFVILNGNYAVPEEGEQYSTSPLNHNLKNSIYKVDLFATVESSPGTLFIDFPRRNRIFFKDLLPTIFASIFFMSIILFSFVYSIMVIFRQKKISAIKSDFINNMTHEFKTPIATINLAADSITSPMIAGNIDKVGRFANIIKQENRRLLNQVEKVLQMSLLEQKRYKLKKTNVNIHEIIKQAIEHTNLQVESRGGKITSELKAENPYIHGDQTHISNIIHNLLDNANKYSPHEPLIDVHTFNNNGNVRIVIKDHGMGMKKDQIKHIFEKFYRVPTGNVHDIKGFGLGLSYVKEMVDAHDGKVSVESDFGKGTSFILQFNSLKEQENKKKDV